MNNAPRFIVWMNQWLCQRCEYTGEFPIVKYNIDLDDTAFEININDIADKINKHRLPDWEPFLLENLKDSIVKWLLSNPDIKSFSLYSKDEKIICRIRLKRLSLLRDSFIAFLIKIILTIKQFILSPFNNNYYILNKEK